MDKKRTLADKNLNLLRRYDNSSRQEWAENVREDEQFRHNVQFTKDQIDKITQRGQAPVVINHIDYAIEQAKVIMTASKPNFVAYPREDSDVKIGKLAETMLSYTYDISDGEIVMNNFIDDFLSKSMGVAVAYFDPYAGNGRGRVKFKDEDPLNIFLDPDTSLKTMQDSDNILIVKEMSISQIIDFYGKQIDNVEQFAKRIVETKATDSNIYPSTERWASEGQVFPGDIEKEETQTAHIIERYTLKPVEMFRIQERFSGREFMLDTEDFKKYLNKSYYIINNKIFTEEQVQFALQQQQQSNLLQTANTQVVKGKQLVQQGIIQAVPVTVKRCFRYVSAEDEFIFKQRLPIDEYPIKFAVNKWNRTPYPSSDVRYSKGLNECLNKQNALVLAHAQATTNVKLLVPEGSVDTRQAKREWAKPDAFIEYNPEFGTPFAPQMNQLPSEFYANMDRLKRQMELQFGVSELSQGIPDNAPPTHAATMSLIESGQRRVAGKLRVIETAFGELGSVLFKLMQHYYKSKDVIRVVQPSGQMSKVRINYMGYDDYSGAIKKFNNISVGEFDFKVSAGSSLPSNRWAKYETYLEMYKLQLIDQVEVLKKSELVDVDGVLERSSQIAQLKNQLNNTVEDIKNLQGDLQTAQRQAVNSQKKVEVEKFKTRLAKILSSVEQSKQLYDARLSDALAETKSETQQQGQTARGRNKNPNRISGGAS